MAAILKEIRVLECGHNPQQQQFFRSTAAFVVSSRDYPSKKHRDSSNTKKVTCVTTVWPTTGCRSAHLSSAAGSARGSTILASVAVTHQLNLLHQRTRVILAIHLLLLQVNFYHAPRLPRTLLVSSKLLLHP